MVFRFFNQAPIDHCWLLHVSPILLLFFVIIIRFFSPIFCTDPSYWIFAVFLVSHLLDSPVAKMAGQTLAEVQLIDFGRSASKAALTGPCGEAFRAGHVSRWLPLGGRQGEPRIRPTRAGEFFLGIRGIAVGNGVAIFFEWKVFDLPTYIVYRYDHMIIDTFDIFIFTHPATTGSSRHLESPANWALWL